MTVLFCGCNSSSPDGTKPVLTNDGGGMDDGVSSAPSGPTACDLTAKLTYKNRGTIAGLKEPPTEYRFSIVIDWTAGTATTGAGGTARTISLLREGGNWTGDIAQQALQLSLALSQLDYV